MSRVGSLLAATCYSQSRYRRNQLARQPAGCLRPFGGSWSFLPRMEHGHEPELRRLDEHFAWAITRSHSFSCVSWISWFTLPCPGVACRAVPQSQAGDEQTTKYTKHTKGKCLSVGSAVLPTCRTESAAVTVFGLPARAAVSAAREGGRDLLQSIETPRGIRSHGKCDDRRIRNQLTAP